MGLSDQRKILKCGWLCKIAVGASYVEARFPIAEST